MAANGEVKILPELQNFTHEQLFFVAFGNVSPTATRILVIHLFISLSSIRAGVNRRQQIS